VVYGFLPNFRNVFAGTLRLTESSLSQNIAKKAGGAVYLLQSVSKVLIEGSVFEENVAFSGAAVFSFGSELYVARYDDAERYEELKRYEKVRCLFRKNTACSGGAWYVTALQDSERFFEVYLFIFTSTVR